MQSNLPNGKPITVTGWGWSADDPAEAQQRAEDAAQASTARIAAGQGFPGSYGYGDKPAREEIIEEINGAEGSLVAMVTRNSYGSVILNTTDLMFIDVDVADDNGSGSLVSMIKGLFGMGGPGPFEAAQQRISDAAMARPQYTFRIYRTAAGFRLAIINKRIKPKSAEAAELLAAFGSDPIYVELCKRQESFRARLSPKPWRCSVEGPRGRYPFESDADENIYRQWEAQYTDVANGYATCQFVEQFGRQEGVADFRKLMELHDRETKADSGFRLA